MTFKIKQQDCNITSPNEHYSQNLKRNWFIDRFESWSCYSTRTTPVAL